MRRPYRIWRAIKIVLSDQAAKREMEKNKKIRKRTADRIDKMVADLNGCSDSWFLSVKTPLDQCVPRDGED